MVQKPFEKLMRRNKKLTRQQATAISSVIIVLSVLFGVVANGWHHYQLAQKSIDQAVEKRVNHQTIAMLNDMSQQDSAHPSKGTIQTAYKTFAAGDFRKAYQRLKPFAVSGDVKSRLILGYLNEFGQGHDQNMHQAALWYYASIYPNEDNLNARIRGLEAFRDGQEAQAAQWFRTAGELGVIV